ncbi:MAG: hypothetical protein LCH87_15390 [Actinobacteria bacterium]|nr:hypothetical protein [Actinomycetota bacterium]MCA0308714.1 hypothetical protein [Actinomycetota bacterium]
MLPDVDQTLLTFPEQATFRAMVRQERGRTVAVGTQYGRLSMLEKAKVVWPAWATGLAFGAVVTTIVFLVFPILELPDDSIKIFMLVMCMYSGSLPVTILHPWLVQRFAERQVLDWLSRIDFEARAKKRQEERDAPREDDYDYRSNWGSRRYDRPRYDF